jgi:uroporphyrinogen decarboxylase
MSKLDDYAFPPAARWTGEELERQRRMAARHRECYYHLCGNASLFETVQNLRNYEDVLIDIAADDPAVGRLMDRLVEHQQVSLVNGLAVDADAVSVGDDFGTQRALIFSMDTWRRFFRPRYRRLLAPVVAARKKVVFHSCGRIGELLPELSELGVGGVWPQLPLFNHRELAKQCRDLGLALQLHPDRGDLLQRATPPQVRDYLLRLVDEFDVLSGGAWLYLEVDPGFPWANVEVMFRTAMELRGN